MGLFDNSYIANVAASSFANAVNGPFRADKSDESTASTACALAK